MAALSSSSSSPIAGCCCVDSIAAVSKSPQTVALNVGNQLRSVGNNSGSCYSQSSIGGRGRLIQKPAGGQQQRRFVGVTRAAADGESFFEKIGTQLFKAGGGKKDDSDSDGPSGTKKFGRTGKKKKEEATDEPPPKSGTQLFNFGVKKPAKSAGSTNGSALAIRTTGLETPQFGRARRVDPKIVFVAGATGQIGARITQQLLRAGFSVRGGVPDLFVAQQLAEFATQYGVLSSSEAKKLNAVEFDFKNVSSIAKALGNAGKVVVTVGPAEDGPLGKVTRADAARVLEAASFSNATHFVLVNEPGSGVIGDNGPLAGLAALFSRVFSRGKEISESDLVDKLIETDLPYTVIKTGSTDGIEDYSPESGNLVVEAEGASDPSAKVSKVQVASVVAGVFQYGGVSENKSFEVTSSLYAPERPVDELLTAIQVDGRRQILREEQARIEAEQKEKQTRLEAEQREKQARLEAEEKEKEIRQKAAAEAKEAIAEARRAAQLAAQLEAEAKRLASEEAKASVIAAKAQAKADAAAASVDGLQERAKELGAGTLKTISGRKGTDSFKSDEKVKIPSFNFPKISRPAEPEPAAVSSSPPPKSKGLFGGLFAPQETIFVDDD